MNAVLRKLWKRLKSINSIVIIIFKFITGFFIIIIFSPLLLFNRFFRKRKFIYLAGLEHVIDKTLKRGEYFEEKGFIVYYYSFETTGRSKEISKHRLIKINRYFVLDLLNLIILFIKKRPVYLEVYFEGPGIRQFFYGLTGFLTNAVVFSIHRGIALNYNKIKDYKVRNIIRFMTYRISDRILYRDPKMISHFKHLDIKQDKFVYDFNKVKIKSEPKYDRSNKVILFLNGIQRFRRIDLLIDAFPYVLKHLEDVQLQIVGCRNDHEYEYIQSLISDKHLNNLIHVEFWTNNTSDYYESASVFVLPADVVFCNYSLIESMERGVPAIVADVDDADRIIDHGVNGYLVKQDAKEIANQIIMILKDDDKRMQMAKEARKTIIEKFNDNERINVITDHIMNKYSYLHFP